MRDLTGFAWVLWAAGCAFQPSGGLSDARVADGDSVVSDGELIADASSVADAGAVDSAISTVDSGSCTEGQTRPCGTDVGACAFGAEPCTGGVWGTCTGSIDPVPEQCNGQDDDCDGTTDNGSLCEANSTCQGGGCVCATGWDDCNGGPGCETYVRADNNNCGACWADCTGRRWECAEWECRDQCNATVCATYFGCAGSEQCYDNTCGSSCP